MTTQSPTRLAATPLLAFGGIALLVAALGALLAPGGSTHPFTLTPAALAGLALTSVAAGAAIDLAPDGRTTRGNARLGGLLTVVVVLIVAMGVMNPAGALLGATGGLDDAPTALSSADFSGVSDPTAPLAVEAFSGTVSGAAAPVIGGVGSNTATTTARIPASATHALVELKWTAATTGASSLNLLVEAKDAKGAWKEMGATNGMSPLTVEFDSVPEGSDEMRLVVSIPSGSAASSQDFEGVVSTFSGAIPDGYKADPSHKHG